MFEHRLVWLVLRRASHDCQWRVASRWETREKAELRAKTTRGAATKVVHHKDWV